MLNIDELLQFLEYVISRLVSDEAIVTITFGFFVVLAIISLNNNIVGKEVLVFFLVLIYGLYIMDEN